MQIVLTFDEACGVDERKAALWCAALDTQAAEFCALHNLPPTPVNYYSTDILAQLENFALTNFVAHSYLVTVQPKLDVPNALGYHNDVLGVIFARVEWQGDDTTITLSHEILELLLDKTCDQYAPKGDGTEQALEACDRVEGDSYVETGAIAGDTLPVNVSNYLRPNAFVPNSAGPWDRMGQLTTWDGLTRYGYEIVRDAAGDETEIDAEMIETERGFEKAPKIAAKIAPADPVRAASVRVVPGGDEAVPAIVRKRQRPDTRLARRLAPTRLVA